MTNSSAEPIRPAGVYSQSLLRHFRRPANVGALDVDRDDIGFGQAGNKKNGCLVRFYLQIDQADQVVNARYRVFGCPVAIAVCSLLSESVVGQPVTEMARLRVAPRVAVIEPPAAKRGVLLIVEDALRAAARNYLAKQA